MTFFSASVRNSIIERAYILTFAVDNFYNRIYSSNLNVSGYSNPTFVISLD
jgi:hypothetical protein